MEFLIVGPSESMIVPNLLPLGNPLRYHHHQTAFLKDRLAFLPLERPSIPSNGKGSEWIQPLRTRNISGVPPLRQR